MKRVLLLIKGLGPGGAEQLLLSAAPFLDNTSLEYHVAYLLPWKDHLVEPLLAHGIQAHCLEGQRGTSWLKRLRRLVGFLDVSLVHGHSPLPAAQARVALRTLHIPFIYTEHLPWVHYHRATYWVNALTFFLNDHVFAVSEAVLDSISYPRPLRFLPMPSRETLYHGVDRARLLGWMSDPVSREELGLPEKALIIGMIGHFRRQKGHPALLQAFSSVAQTFPDARLVLVGHGPQEDEIRGLVTALGLDRTVVFTGSRPDAARVIPSFDIFVLPSIYEGLPIALLEAMTMGKPIVATAVSGIKELIDAGIEGILVPPGDVDALARALTRLLEDTRSRDRLGEAASRRAVRYSIEAAVKRWESIYREYLGTEFMQ